MSRPSSTLLTILSLLAVAPTSAAQSETCNPTTRAGVDKFFYQPDAPFRDQIGPLNALADPSKVLHLEGQILGNDCEPFSNAIIEVWYAGVNVTDVSQAHDAYKDFRGQLETDECGRYNLEQTFPVRLLNSPHVSFRITADDGTELLLTEMYFEGTIASA